MTESSCCFWICNGNLGCSLLYILLTGIFEHIIICTAAPSVRSSWSWCGSNCSWHWHSWWRWWSSILSMTRFLVLVLHSEDPGEKINTKLENFVADAWSCLNSFFREKMKFFGFWGTRFHFSITSKSFVITFLQFGESSELYFEKTLVNKC